MLILVHNIAMDITLNKMKSEIKIIVVDDMPANLLLLEEILRIYGYQVHAFNSGRRALDAVENINPDLILLDVCMPVMDGYEVCTELKANEKLRDIPVIFVSAMSETIDKVNGFKVGGVDYITKPFQIDEVNARVKAHLTLRFQQQELQQSYNRLRELEEMRENLVNMIVHDMRSPLFGIVGMLDLMQISLKTKPEKCQQYLDATLATTHQLTEMVNSLLDVSRLEDGKMPINVSLCDVEYLINQAIKLLNLDQSDIELNIEMLTENKEILCDSGLIRRVIQHLLSNAVKFNQMGGRITVRVERIEDYMKISVIDNGPGIPIEYQDKIFDKFGQVNSQTNNRKYAIGLGLAFCKLVIQSHHGDIGVNSLPDEGSNFWFSLKENPDDIGKTEI